MAVQLTFIYLQLPLVLATIVLTLILKRLLYPPKRKNSQKEVLGLDDIYLVPQVFPGKLIGGIPTFWPISKALKVGEKLAASTDGLAKLYGCNQTFVGLHTPELVQILLKSTDFDHNVKSGYIYGTMKGFINNGLLVSTGKFWQQQRKILMKTQHFQNLKAYMEMLNKHNHEFVHGLKNLFSDGKVHQINESVNVLFLKVISEIIIGAAVESAPNFDRYFYNFQLWKESLVKRVLSPWLLYDPIWRLHPMSRKQAKAIKEMEDFARERIKEHKTRRSNKETCSDSTANLYSFRSVLDELVDAGVDEVQTLDEINTMLFGGHDTGSGTIHHLCFVLALNPDIQRQCQQEVDAAFENPECVINGGLKFETVNTGLKYVERCIQETLRLYPTIFIFLRELKADLVIEHKNRTYLLPAGTNIAHSPYAMQRDERYFPDPLKFDPDRFLPENVAKRHPFAYNPFSAGQRSCLGMKFAMLESKLVAAYILRNFEITTTDTVDDVPLMPFITLTPQRDYNFIFKIRGQKMT